MSAPVPTTRPIIRAPNNGVLNTDVLQLVKLDRFTFATQRSSIMTGLPLVVPTALTTYYRTRIKLSKQGPGNVRATAYGSDCDVIVTIGAGSGTISLPGGSPTVDRVDITGLPIDTWLDVTIEAVDTGAGALFIAFWLGEMNLTTGDLPP
jgi:hypothetical protein